MTDVTDFQVIQSYPNYSINRQGIVKNNKTDRIIKYYVSENGYKLVSIVLDGIKKNKRIHKLVAQTFLGAREIDMIDHINRDRLNNNVSNLRITTSLKNCHNRNPISTKETRCTGVTIVKNKYRSTITINYKSMTKVFELDYQGFLKAIMWRIHKRIQYGIIN